MDQLHRRFSDEQIVFLFEAYTKGLMRRMGVQEALGIGKTRFFALLKEFRQDPEGFSVSYHRSSPKGISPAAEAAIEKELLREKALLEDPELPISDYNYSALRDRLKKQGITVSLYTIIDRAKKLNCHQPRKKKKAHDREVLTASVGALIQHDGSTHRWSPYTKEKWTLITSIDDYSRPGQDLRQDPFRRLRPQEDNPGSYSGCPDFDPELWLAFTLLRGLLTCVSFRPRKGQLPWTAEGSRTGWRKHVLETDDVETQWGKMMRVLNVDVTYTLSPQAKGKVERLYRWLQDGIVRTCIYEQISEMEECRSVLRDELNRYNNHQVHSTTGEIPNIRYERARKEGNSLFRKFVIPKPYTSTKDVFCLREKRIVNGYRRISLFKHVIEVPNVPLREDVDVHLVPDDGKQLMHIRIWWNRKMVHSVSLPLQGFHVHF